MKIALFSDIHGNQQALEAILQKTTNYDKIIFLGDAIGIGPNPKECIQILLNSNVEYLIGNHEQYLLEGYQKFNNIYEDAYSHHEWVRSETIEFIDKIKKLKQFVEIKNNLFIHYSFFNNRYLRPNDYPTIAYLNDIFKNYTQKAIFFGHSHNHNQIEKYYCLGSSGCTHNDETFFTEVTINNNSTDIKRIYLKYDREKFIKTIKDKDYPLKNHLAEIFFGIKE